MTATHAGVAQLGQRINEVCDYGLDCIMADEGWEPDMDVEDLIERTYDEDYHLSLELLKHAARGVFVEVGY